MCKSPLKRAIEAAEARTGLKGSAALADALGHIITRQAIDQWDVIPLARVPDVARATGIPREELRPDFFEDPSDKGSL
jgi:DNA-binding transcriptional regulator YdaS (Cro superfamily)